MRGAPGRVRRRRALVRRTPQERAALARAKARLDRLDFHPRPVDTRRTRIWRVPWLFRAPWFRRFQGYEAVVRPPELRAEPERGEARRAVAETR